MNNTEYDEVKKNKISSIGRFPICKPIILLSLNPQCPKYVANISQPIINIFTGIIDTK